MRQHPDPAAPGSGTRSPGPRAARLPARWAPRRRPPTRRGALTVAVCFLAGLMITVSAISARGTDLRPARNTELVDLLRSEADRNRSLAKDVAALRADVDALTAAASPGSGDTEASDRLARQSGLVPVDGPGVTVTLTDAPLSIDPAGVDGDLLVVHQQDIQAVVNELWQGGAEAMTIQGQRVVATTGIKCVGNTVVLHGVPYAPPYVISAIGEPGALEAGLADSEYIAVYQQYVEAYGLGYQQQAEDELQLPGFTGGTTLSWAAPHEPG